MKKHLVAYLLLGAITISSLAGCGQGKEVEESSKTSETKQEESSSNSNSSESVEEEEKPEMTTVKILCTANAGGDKLTADWENYDVSQVFIKELEEIGVRLELECIDQQSLDNVIATRLAAGVDLPDLISYPYDAHDRVYEFASSGLVYSINELLEQYDEDGSIKAFYEEYAPGIWEMSTTPDGNVYWFSYLSCAVDVYDPVTGLFYEPKTPWAIQIRKNWAEKVGEEFKEVYSPDELFDLLLKMNQEDANGNGKNDEVIALNIGNFHNGIATAFGLTNDLLAGYFTDDNKVFSNFQHENFPAYIEFMNKLYENGLYDTAALTDVNQITNENRATAVYGYPTIRPEDKLMEIESDASYRPIYLDLDGDITNGFHHYTDAPAPTGYYNYFVPKNCENPEGVLRLMDYIYTDEYALLCRYGIEGESWEWSEETNAPEMKEGFVMNEDTLWGTGIGLKALPAVVRWGQIKERSVEDNPDGKYDKMNWTVDFMVYSANNARLTHGNKLAMKTEEEEAITNEYEEILSTYAQELLTDLILGEKSLDDLPDYLEEMEELGLSKFVDVVQARRDRALGK